MSHAGHTHGPGESHSHSHAPQQQQIAPPPDPALQALIDQSFSPVPLTLSTPDPTTALCKSHSLEKCTPCNTDFTNLNRLSKLLVANPNLLCPPPANVVSQKLSQAITNTKEEGNAFFKMGLHAQAIARYNMAASIATQRPPWEANQLMREELSTVVSNRSAAYFESGDFISALVDAETVIQLRRNWSKGHFRKAKALLGLAKIGEAMEAVRLGLAFEPNNVELNGFLAEIERLGRHVKDTKVAMRNGEKSEKQEEKDTPLPPAPAAVTA